MKIHQIRNATMVIEAGEHVILVDPMLGPKGSMAPFTIFRYRPRKNPIVELPDNTTALLEKVTHCLITHKHPDHIDPVAEQFLKEKNIPVTCSIRDKSLFTKKGLNVVQVLEYWKETDFLGGTIMGTPARHGYGYVAKPMGNVMGFYLVLSGELSLYLSSDTIYTDDVKKVLKEKQPQIAVVASGTARLDFFQPLLMKVDDIVQFTKDAPGKVIANHLEAVNHCPTKRTDLKERMEKEGLADKVLIPDDGEAMSF